MTSQQYAVLVADLAQSLQVSRRRRNDAGRSRHGFDDNRGDIAAVVQQAKPGEVFRQLDTVLRQTAGERIAFYIERMAQMIDTGKQYRTEHLAIRHDAANRHAAEVHTVIALLAPDEPCTVAFAARAVIADGDLQCGVDRLGAGVRKEAVVDALRRHRGDALGEFQCLVIRYLERHAVVQRGHLLLHGFDDLRVAVAEPGRPQPRKRVVQARTVVGRVPVSTRARDDTWLLVEVAVGRKRHPIRGFDCGTHAMRLRVQNSARTAVYACYRMLNNTLAGDK